MKALQWTLAAVLLCCHAVAGADSLLIRNAQLHTMTAAGTLASADILVRDGRIAEIGSNLQAPVDSTELDAAGRPVTPALFAGITALGLNEIDMVWPSVDSAVTQIGSPPMRPEFNVTSAYNPHSSPIPVTRIEGFGFSL
ncbi:MAG TPA: amidohydrolase, partial [Alcanivorax sp.]|nr:amidohydrolase [Alcanivorax sp.]